jgi:argininosuccinate lyase
LVVTNWSPRNRVGGYAAADLAFGAGVSFRAAYEIAAQGIADYETAAHKLVAWPNRRTDR